MLAPHSLNCTSRSWRTSIVWRQLSNCRHPNQPRAGGNDNGPHLISVRSFLRAGRSAPGRHRLLEHVSEAAEADLFRHLIRRQVIQRLAETYPTPRKKEEVPIWIYLSSELTLKLHGAQSYHAFPRILRCGGLIDALGPEMGGRKTPHPETGDVTLACPGFNDKNDYDRQTPCDQDFLRKFAHDTNTDRLHAWFNREVPRCLRSLGLFDPEGLFIGDASYLFVPDNEHYEQSDVLWFDEHNHPVDADKVDLRDQRYQQHRCYKLVSLIHVLESTEFQRVR